MIGRRLQSQVTSVNVKMKPKSKVNPQSRVWLWWDAKCQYESWGTYTHTYTLNLEKLK